jgi:hypothetical protein
MVRTAPSSVDEIYACQPPKQSKSPDATLYYGSIKSAPIAS